LTSAALESFKAASPFHLIHHQMTRRSTKEVFMKVTKRIDLWTGVALMALSVAVWLLTADLPTPKRGIGPGDYPRVITAVLFVLGLTMTISNLISGYPGKGEKTNWKYLGRMALLAVMAFSYVRLLKMLGFPLLTPFFLFATIALFGYKRWWMNVLVSVLTTAVIFLLFNVIFMVFLPMGKIF
jgi:putative tricarboxylic transport membrane protein